MLRPAGVAKRPSGRTAVLAVPMVGAMLPAGALIGTDSAGASETDSESGAPRLRVLKASTITVSTTNVPRRKIRLAQSSAPDPGGRTLPPAAPTSPRSDVGATPGM